MRIIMRVMRLFLAVGWCLFAASPIFAGDPLAKHFGGPFTLTSHDGRAVSDDDFRGRFMLVAFGYTHCPDICPTVLTEMTNVLERLGAAADAIQPIFITVDPARDTADVLSQYRKSFHPRFVMLTGNEQQVAGVAKAYKVHRRKYLFPRAAAPDSNAYGVDHGSLVYLMGPDGKFVTFFPYGTSADKMEGTLRRYVEGGASSH